MRNVTETEMETVTTKESGMDCLTTTMDGFGTETATMIGRSAFGRKIFFGIVNLVN